MDPAPYPPGFIITTGLIGPPILATIVCLYCRFATGATSGKAAGQRLSKKVFVYLLVLLYGMEAGGALMRFARIGHF